MTATTLIEELRAKAGEETLALWEKAEADAQDYRAGRQRAVEEQRTHAAQELAVRAADFERAAKREAEQTARKELAAAKAALADRLHTLAVKTLVSVRDHDYPVRFSALAAELPSRKWQRVIVNPADRSMAQMLFPQATVATDPRIAGGMEVETEAGRVRVSNTLESRLEAAWPELLTALMNDILEEISHS